MKLFSKKTLKTKSFWVGVALIGWGIYGMIEGDSLAQEKIAAGVAMITGRDAISKLDE